MTDCFRDALLFSFHFSNVVIFSDRSIHEASAKEKIMFTKNKSLVGRVIAAIAAASPGKAVTRNSDSVCADKV